MAGKGKKKGGKAKPAPKAQASSKKGQAKK